MFTPAQSHVCLARQRKMQFAKEREDTLPISTVMEISHHCSEEGRNTGQAGWWGTSWPMGNTQNAFLFSPVYSSLSYLAIPLSVIFFFSEVEVLVILPWVSLCDPIDCNPPGSSLSMGFSRQEYWSEVPFPSPGDLPNSETEPGSPALHTDSLPSETPGKH